jgi:hypothetical protein
LLLDNPELSEELELKIKAALTTKVSPIVEEKSVN